MANENRELVNESWLEGGVGCCLEADRNVVELRDQWPAVEYVDQHGEVHTHTFDWHVTHKDGKRFAIDARPRARLGNLPDVIALIRKQRAHREFADGMAIITERDFTNDDVVNAKQVLRSRLHRDEGEMNAAVKELRSVRGTVYFGDLVRKAPVEAYRRMAMWGMIDLGILLPVERQRVNDRTTMWVNHAALNEAYA